jgi:hypothetical protein
MLPMRLICGNVAGETGNGGAMANIYELRHAMNRDGGWIPQGASDHGARHRRLFAAMGRGQQAMC